MKPIIVYGVPNDLHTDEGYEIARRLNRSGWMDCSERLPETFHDNYVYLFGGTAVPPDTALPAYTWSEVSPRPVSARQEGAEHYRAMDIQPWDVIDKWPREQRIGFYRGNLLKYTMRMGSKDAAPAEIEKAAHYARKLKEVLDEEACTDVTAKGPMQ